MNGISVVGGKIQYPGLTNKLSDKDFAITKMHIWLTEINAGRKPKKWLKANNKGTGIQWTSIQSQDEYDICLLELKHFIREVDEKFDLDIVLNDGEANA